MRHRAFPLASMAVAGLLLLPACGAGDGSDGATTTTAVTRGDVPVAAWSKQFCAQFATWLAGLDAERERAGARLSVGDLPGGRAAVVDLFVRSRRQTDEFVDAVGGLGAPDAARGIEFAASVKRRMEAFGAAMDDAAEAAEELPAQDPGGLQLELAALVNRYEEAMNEASRAMTDLDGPSVAPDLQEALVSACGS